MASLKITLAIIFLNLAVSLNSYSKKVEPTTPGSHGTLEAVFSCDSPGKSRKALVVSSVCLDIHSRPIVEGDERRTRHEGLSKDVDPAQQHNPKRSSDQTSHEKSSILLETGTHMIGNSLGCAITLGSKRESAA